MIPVIKLHRYTLEDAVAIVKPHVSKSARAYLNNHVAEYYETTSREDTIEAAYDFADSGNYKVIISCGGDGTLNAVYTGIYMSDNPHCPIGLFRGNGGNGAHDSVDIPHLKSSQLELIVNALEVRKEAVVQPVDIIQVVPDKGNSVYAQFFGIGATGEVIYHRENLNAIGERLSMPKFFKKVGIEDEIKNILRSSHFHTIKYLGSTLWTLLRNNGFKAYIESPENNWHFELCREITLGNRTTPGKGIKLLPYSDIHGGEFDVRAFSISNFEMLLHNGVIARGVKRNIPGIAEFKTHRMKVTFYEKAPFMHYDGESYYNSKTRELFFRIIPKAVSFIMPRTVSEYET